MIPQRQAVLRRPTGTPGIIPRNCARTFDVIPYEYGATFPITGEPGNLVQAVVSVGGDGVFVAEVIGYGFEEDRTRSILLEGTIQSTSWSDLKLVNIPRAVMIRGFRLNPRKEQLVFESEKRTGRMMPRRVLSGVMLPAEIIRGNAQRPDENLFQEVAPRKDISFLFSIVDSSTGQELSDEPTSSLSSLGASDGRRPFRRLAHPMMFLPRSTARLQIVERTEGIRGTLFIVLIGYKVLTGSGVPETVVRSVLERPPTHGIRPDTVPGRTLPFDYVTTFPLTGTPRNRIEDEISIDSCGEFVATAIGYGVEPPGPSVFTERFLKEEGDKAATNLKDVKLEDLSPDALIGGIRVRPEFLGLLYKPDGDLVDELPVRLLDLVFEPINRPEDLSFRYEIFEDGRGCSLMNMPLNSVSSLGTATGNRPFKQLVRPLVIRPGASLRIRVEEGFGRGTLFIVFQGYKNILSLPSGGRP